jgi:Type I phosphodiesterase / nucleotide pyrophosphatase
MPRDTRSLFLPAVLFALTLTVDVLHAVLRVNRLSYASADAFRIACAAVALVGVPAAIGIALLGRLLGRWVSNAAAAALGLALAGLVFYGLAEAAFEPDQTRVLVRGHLGLAAFMLLALIALARLPRPRLALAGACAAGVALTLAASARNVSYASLGGEIERLRAPAPFRGRLLLLGVDGLGWDTLERWSAAHPNGSFAWFRQHAVAAPLQTLVPTLSPRIWSSIATGVPPDQHGVVAFTSLDYAGLDHSRLLAPRLEGAFYWSRLLQALGAARRLPVSSFDLRKPPVWEILARPAYPVDVLAWWATWPAQPLAGRMVSDRFYFSRGEPAMDFAQPDATPPPPASTPTAAPNSGPTSGITAPATTPPTEGPTSGITSGITAPPDSPDPAAGLTFPPALAAELAPLRRAPDDITAAELARFLNPADDEQDRAANPASSPDPYDPRTELRYAYSSDQTWFGVATNLLDSAPPNTTMVAYFRGVDMASHGAMRFSHLYPETAQANRATGDLYSEVICRYYEYTFALLRKVIEQSGENTMVLIVSDHGFEPSGGGQFGHYHAPPGVLLALGGGRTGVETAQQYTVYDVAPTLLWLRGFPAARDMPGHARADLFPNLGGGEPRALPTYGYRLAAPDAGRGDARTDAEMMRLLRTLGYVK